MATIAQPRYRQRLAYQAGLLGGICCLVSILLIVGNRETNGLINTHLEQEKRDILAKVLPASLYDNTPLTTVKRLPQSGAFTSPVDVFTATKEGHFSGAALLTSVYGWGSDIHFILAVNASGEITGVRVISHRETPGLADKIEVEKSDWITHFNGMSLSNTPKSHWAVKKDGGDIDQFTGATITPRAVVKGIYQSMLVLDQWSKQQKAQLQEQAQKKPEANKP